MKFFVPLFDVKGLCWLLYDPHINCNAIAGVVWTVNNDHDTTNTPKNLKNSKKIDEVKSEGIWWTCAYL